MKKRLPKIAAAIIAALCMTACGTVKTDAHGIQTSVVQTTPSAAQTSVPAAQATAPSVQTEAPSAQTEAPSAQTEAPSAQTIEPSTQTTAPAATEYEESVLREDDFTVSKTSYSILLEFESLKKTIYDFRDARTYGAASVKSNGVDTIDFEGIFGIRIDATGSNITYSVYRHSSSISENASVVLYRVNADENTVVKRLGTAKADDSKKLTSKLSDGLYMLTATFEVDSKNIPISGYLYVENGDAVTCRLATISQYNLDRFIDAWNNLLSDADPDDFLSNEKITYPTSGTDGCCNHVSEWEEISDEIIGNHDRWTDEMKVFAFVDYLSKNVAYDNYRYKQLNPRSRANLAGDYTDDSNFTLGNGVGVCWDYTNILTIMCRHHGIACTSIDNSAHTFNAVWLNGGWVGIDLTETRRYACNTKDTDRDNWVNMSYSYSRYGGYNISHIMDSYDQNIWTMERGLGLN